jgi:hypothetical protein
MIYEKRLRREKEALVEVRTITVHEGTGYSISTEDKPLQGSLLAHRSSGATSAQWRATKQGALGLAERMVGSSIDDGFVLLDSV